MQWRLQECPLRLLRAFRLSLLGRVAVDVVTANLRVARAILGAVRRLRELGKPSGILYFGEAQNRQAMAWGTTFTAVGADIGLLAAAARALRASYA